MNEDEKKEFEALKKQVADASNTIKTLNDTITQQQEFVQDASVLVGAIYQNKELTQKVKDQITAIANGEVVKETPKKEEKEPTKETPKETPKDPVTDPRVDRLDAKERNQAIETVEQKLKIKDMKPEKIKEIRRNVEKQLNDWNMSIVNIPIDKAEDLLGKAYMLVTLDEAKAEGKEGDLVENYMNPAGAMPSMQGSSSQNETIALSEEQKKWAGKLGVDEDKVAKNLKELTETGVITYKPKEEREQSRTVPSGTPREPNNSSS